LRIPPPWLPVGSGRWLKTPPGGDSVPLVAALCAGVAVEGAGKARGKEGGKGAGDTPAVRLLTIKVRKLGFKYDWFGVVRIGPELLNQNFAEGRFPNFGVFWK